MPTERRAYSRDLSNAEWQIPEPMLPPEPPGGRHRKYTRRQIIKAIHSILGGGWAWRLIPHDLPHWRAADAYLRPWRIDATGVGIHDHLHAQLRTQMQRPAPPSAPIIDWQSVKTTEKGGLTATMGRRRSAAESGIYLLIERVL